MRRASGRLAMGLLGTSLAIVAVLVVGVLGVGGYLYATDYKLEATVQDTDCGRGDVDVKTKLFGLEHTVPDVPAQQCNLLAPGNFVEYRLRSERTTLYQSEGGACIYDSETGPACGGTMAPGGSGLF